VGQGGFDIEWLYDMVGCDILYIEKRDNTTTKELVMKKATYFRKGKTIRGPEGDKTYKFYNEAKRASRAIQKSGGVLRNVEKLPNVG